MKASTRSIFDLFDGKPAITDIKLDESFVEPCHPAPFFDALNKIWNPDYVAPRYKLAEPEWLIGMSNQFVKDIHQADRKMQGRILEAISQILREPNTTKGDTIKPLKSDKKGLWRFRIGHYRLVYHPDGQNRKIKLMSFGSRSDVYEQ
jgi:addiction module RelE/StbE family toxin